MVRLYNLLPKSGLQEKVKIKNLLSFDVKGLSCTEKANSETAEQKPTLSGQNAEIIFLFLVQAPGKSVIQALELFAVWLRKFHAVLKTENIRISKKPSFAGTFPRRFKAPQFFHALDRLPLEPV